MNLLAAIDSYVSLKRSLGAVFSAETRILNSFGRTLGNVSIEAITHDSCLSFCRGSGPATLWWERKHYTLLGFFAFLVSREDLTATPMPNVLPRIPRTFVPYIYTHQEIQRLLDATDMLNEERSRLLRVTFRTLLLLLYAAGLRPGEGLRLRCCDIDLTERVLAIWDTKYFKSRLVPIGTDLAKALKSYRVAREDLSMPEGTHSPFFASPSGRRISLNKLETVFVLLRRHARIKRIDSRWQPRLHDLRHAFAVHRLVAWYREGADVQACLPLLATYLGHANISGTQTYLTMTSEILSEASKRFDCYASIGKDDDHDC